LLTNIKLMPQMSIQHWWVQWYTLQAHKLIISATLHQKNATQNIH